MRYRSKALARLPYMTGKITIYEKNGEHRASLDITGSYVLTLPAAVGRKSRQEAAMVKMDHDVGRGND